MNLYENCSICELEDGSLFFEEILTPYGVAECVYLGPGGIYVILSETDKALEQYEYFRHLLGASRVRLYFLGKGEYLPSSKSFTNELDSDELYEVIYDYINKFPQQYTKSTLERMKTALLKSDARNRGCYTDENGVIYLFRYGEFVRSSEVNSEHIFNLCLYGGAFGLHRFALGKWFSGLLYIFTCGLFLFGWLFDLVQLFFCFQKDKKRNLLLPLENRIKKLRLLPVGIIISFVALIIWLQMFNITTEPASFSPSLSSFLQRFL